VFSLKGKFIMLKFNALTLAQKKCVVALIEADPSLKKTGEITLKQVVTITQDLAARRDAGAPKIGYPNWLFKANKIEKGLYKLPVPTAQELSDYAQASTKSVKTKVVKVKATKVIAPKVAKTKKVAAPKVALTEEELEAKAVGRLQSIISESDVYDADEEDFNAILRENGIEV